MNYEIILYIITHLACSVCAYGLTFAYFDREFDLIAEKKRNENIRMAIFVALAGPLGLITALYCGDWMKHGWKFN